VSLTTPTWAQDSALTSGLLHNLSDLMAQRGTMFEVPAVVASPLRLSAKGQIWVSKQIGIPDARPGFHHAFGVGTGSDEDTLFTLRTPDKLYFYRVRRSGEIVAATVYVIQTGITNLRSHAEAQKGLDAELARWTQKLFPGAK
jgi:hypothetical protein